MSGSFQANCLLIDGVLRPDAAASLYQRGEALEVWPLYIGTRWAELQDLGPILVSAKKTSSLLSEWHKSVSQKSDSCALLSQAPMSVIADHLRNFISPPDHNGNTGLLRFADPLVTHFWLSSYGAAHLNRILGPIENIWVKAPIHTWQAKEGEPLTLFTKTRITETSDSRFNVLGEHQVNALELAYRWQFKERLYEWLNTRDTQTFSLLNDAQTEWWLEYVLDSGRAWGLVSERGLVTWAETCVDWGKDFATRPDSPYQEWLKLAPENRRLAPEVRIEALDDYRQQQLVAKDTADA